MTPRTLLRCGILAGPLYVAITLIESFTRDGFDLRHHRFSWLTTGDLGWIHQLAMVMVGLLSILLALGMRQVVRTGRGSVWAPRLLGLFGVAYVVGGLLRADPVVGFPPGTTPDMVQVTWHGIAQNASRSASSLFLVALSLVLARRFAGEGRRVLAWCSGAGIPLVFAVLTIIGLGIGGNPTAIAFLMTPWIWVTGLAIHLARGATEDRGSAVSGRPVAGPAVHQPHGSG